MTIRTGSPSKLYRQRSPTLTFDGHSKQASISIIYFVFYSMSTIKQLSYAFLLKLDWSSGFWNFDICGIYVNIFKSNSYIFSTHDIVSTVKGSNNAFCCLYNENTNNISQTVIFLVLLKHFHIHLYIRCSKQQLH